MLGSRRGRPSLLGRAAGTAARTAVITKTATAVAGSSAQKQMARAQTAELAHAERMAAVGGGGAQPAPADAGTAAPSSAGESGGSAGGDMGPLLKLAELHDSGILTDAEFITKVKDRLHA